MYTAPSKRFILETYYNCVSATCRTEETRDGTWVQASRLNRSRCRTNARLQPGQDLDQARFSQCGTNRCGVVRPVSRYTMHIVEASHRRCNLRACQTCRGCKSARHSAHACARPSTRQAGRQGALTHDRAHGTPAHKLASSYCRHVMRSEMGAPGAHAAWPTCKL